MLKFCRTKFVGYEFESETILKVFGTLDDTLYSMQVELRIELPELVVRSIRGNMRRFTTPFCEDATDFLKNAEGIKIEPGFQSIVKRLVGRPGCRHFGNLINECLESLFPALVCMRYKDEKENNPEVTMKEVLEQLKAEYPQINTYCTTFSNTQ